MLNYQTNKLEESFVIRFGTEHSRINAYTLASSLVAISDAAKAANAVINPGFEIEIVVESLGKGSFKACVKAVYRDSKNLFSNAAVQAVVLGVIGNYIYQQTLAPDLEVNVKVLTEEVVIQAGDKTLVVPRIVYDSCRNVEQVPSFSTNVSKVFKTVERDKEVQFLEIQKLEACEKHDLPISIPRERFAMLSSELGETLEDTREIIETTDLQIIRMILERGTRKWEFSWRGFRISAPLTHSQFYDDLTDRKITVGMGDGLQVRLKITQKLDHNVGIYTNVAYEVVEVLEHIPRYKQDILE